jgi:hypothetical protein
MYNPTVESGSNPDGEWVELYNNSGSTVDLTGWYIKDLADHTMTIDAAHTNTGLVTISASSWLVVYRNGSAILNNTGDTISLFDSSNNLIDSHTYVGGKATDLTEARIPDGTGAWVDPVATPGTANQLFIVVTPTLTPEPTITETPTPTLEPSPTISLEPTPTVTEAATPTPTNEP